MVRQARANLLFAVLLAITLLLIVPTVSAETISLDYGCTLNNAIRSALTDSSVGGCRAGDPGRDILYVVDTVKIVEPPVEITQDMGFVGDRFTSTLDGQGRFSFFRLAPGVSVNLQDFFMSNGYGTRESGQIRLGSGARVHLNTANIINCKGVKEIVAPSDAQVGIGLASSVCGKSEPFNPHPPVSPPPDPPDNPPVENPGKPGHKPTTERSSSSKRLVKPAAYTCENLPDNILVRPVAGTRGGIQCQALNESGVGRQELIDSGIVAAVDIWGQVDPGVEVCLRGQGPLVFLDAAYAPRAATPMPSYRQGDMICAFFERAGSLVLLASFASIPNETAQVQQLESCTVRVVDALFFRDAPAGSTIYGLFPANTALQADARTSSWFKVVHNGIEGWISADYVETSGTCE